MSRRGHSSVGDNAESDTLMFSLDELLTLTHQENVENAFQCLSVLFGAFQSFYRDLHPP